MGLYNTVPVVSDEYGNTGLQNFVGDIGYEAIVVAVPKGTSIATKVLAETLATWVNGQNAAQASRWLPIGKIVDAEKPNPEPTYKETGFGFRYWVKDNKPTFRFMVEPMTIYNKNQINKLSLKKFDFFFVTVKEYIHGWQNGLEFMPYTAEQFRVEPATGITGAEGEYIWMEIQFSDINQFNKWQAAINPTVDSEAPAVWYPTLEIKGIKDLVVTASGGSASGFTIDLAGFDGTPYDGAVAGDISIHKSTAPTVAIAATGATLSSTIPGRYAVTHATQTAGTFAVGLLPQPTATTNGFETPTLFDLIWA